MKAGVKKAERVRASDWLDAGLDILRDEGERALTIDALCARLGRTKGSFYHHFEALEPFLRAMLERWRERHTIAPIREATAAASSARGQARALDEIVTTLDRRLEIAIRAWALRDQATRASVEEIDRIRIDHLASLHRAAGMSAARSRAVARVEYAVFVGVQMIEPDLRAASAQRVRRDLERALEALEDPPSADR